jgi:chromosome segregation ATPase
LRKSIEDDAKNAALCEKGLVEEIKSLKSQLAVKEKERIETVEALHNMESRCISVGAKLETKIEDYDNLKKELQKVVREKNYVKKKSSEKDQNFHNKCNRLWDLCKNCYDKFGAKPEDPCWELGEFDPFFAWLCRQCEDLPTVIQTSAHLSCI